MKPLSSYPKKFLGELSRGKSKNEIIANQIIRLKKCYPSINDERQDIFSAYLEKFDTKKILDIVNEIIANCRYSPTLNDFKLSAQVVVTSAELNEAREISNDILSSSKNRSPCKWCNNQTGFIHARKKVKPIETYIFKCSCKNADNHQQPYPRWSTEKHSAEYEKTHWGEGNFPVNLTDGDTENIVAVLNSLKLKTM